jgi:hypothetical protein
VGENFLEDTARALCERPNETAEKGASRTIQMVHTVLSMSPRDGLEVVISTMA